MKDWEVGEHNTMYIYVRATWEWNNAPVKGHEWENANMKVWG